LQDGLSSVVIEPLDVVDCTKIVQGIRVSWIRPQDCTVQLRARVELALYLQLDCSLHRRWNTSTWWQQYKGQERRRPEHVVCS
jgi:hypothetical protein